MKLEAAYRLIAVKADEKQAKVFLESVGFTGLQPKLSSEDRISFKYTGMDRKFLEKHYGQAKKTGPTQIAWKFGLDGYIVLKENSNIVVLQNSKRNAKRLTPIETHVPEGTPETPKRKPTAPIPKVKPTAPLPKPGYDDPEDVPPPKLPPSESPNNPGSKENDDSHVPVTKLSDDLDKRYKYCQGIDDAAYRLGFNKRLWEYLNEHKFGGRMQLPRLGMLKNMSSTKMRLRGRWWASKRLLEVAPRLYNAHQNFFVEIFLHEMCHQAVSEIDRVFDRTEQGHGPHWQAWMRKVGLNPRRFDPNDNTTYMKDHEKEAYERKKEEVQQKREVVKEKIQEQGLRHMYRIDEPCLATVNWNNEIHHGVVACPTGQNRANFAFVASNTIYSERHMLVPAGNIFEFAGSDEQRERCNSQAMKDKVQKIRNYYERKSDRRAFKRDIRKRYGF
jgi:predicted SprT family Zn-dependent metalloprotease